MEHEEQYFNKKKIISSGIYFYKKNGIKMEFISSKHVNKKKLRNYFKKLYILLKCR